MSSTLCKHHPHVDYKLAWGCPDCIVELRQALEESVKLQSHYASLLNTYDDGQRIGFKDGEAWMKRLKKTGVLK